MGIIKEIFGKVRIYQLRSRVDSRGFMSYVFDENIYDFSIKEARIYSMPKEGTFFGIHYKEESSPMTKLVTVIKGKGMDYVPAGFGHAFISLQKDTIQLYAVDRSGADAHSEHINYSDPQIGLKLPMPVSEISDYDQNAPFVFK